jgi:type IX secretion system PorP/SprF family membrane protein
MAQQDAQYSMFMFNNLAINPGFAGSNDAICASAIQRRQYMGFPGAPITTVVNVDAPISKINSGVGLTLNNDIIGNYKTMNILVHYAYRVNVGDGQLGLGLNFGILNSALSGEWIPPESLNSGLDENATAIEDPLIPTSDAADMVPDFSFGAFYRLQNLYVGFSSTHLNQANLNYVTSESGESKMSRHYYVTAGYFYKLPNPLFELRPNILIKSDLATSTIDANISLLYNKVVWGGVSYRHGDAMVAMAGVELKNGLKIGYSFDFVTNKIGTYNRASHEVLLGYCFNLNTDKAKGSYKSVRIL